MLKETNEPLWLIKKRNIATQIVENNCKYLENELNWALTHCHAADAYLSHVDSTIERFVKVYSGDLERTLTDVYRLGSRDGLREVRSAYITNQAEPVFVDNNIKDLWRKASEKAKAGLGKLGSTIKDSLKKAFSKKKKKESAPKTLSPNDLAKFRDKTADTVAKMKKQIKRDLQDDITSAVAEGKLDSYEVTGITSAMVQIETVRDNRRCTRCAELDNLVVPIEQARALLPVHINCRCMWRLQKPKGAKKEIVREQKVQEHVAVKLRQRLDKRYKQVTKQNARKSKAVHNALHDEMSVFNEYCSFADSVNGHVVYANVVTESHENNSLHVVCKAIQGDLLPHRHKQRICVGRKWWGLIRPVAGDKISLRPGAILQLDWFNQKSGEAQYSVVGDVGGWSFCDGRSQKSQSRAEKCRRLLRSVNVQTIPFLPTSITEYPYELACDVNDLVSVVMLNPKRGFIKTGGMRTALQDFDKLLEYIVDSALIYG